MKKFILITCLMLANILYAQNQLAENWRNDLDYLVQRIEIMHPNPYAFLTKEKFYTLKEKLCNDIPNLSDVDVVISISELLASLKDGHTRWAFEKSDPNWLMQTFHSLPIIQYPFEDGIFILACLPQYKDLIGSKVLKIGETPINEVAAKLGKLWSHDNSSGERKYLYYTLSMAEMLRKIGAINDINNVDLLLLNRKNEEIKTQVATVPLMNMAGFFAGTWYPQAGNGLVTINETAQTPIPLWLKNQNKSFWYEYIPVEKIMYLQINSFNFPLIDTNEEGSFNQLCKQFFNALDQNAAEKLIIDIRANNGGNHVELPLLKGIIARSHIDRQGKLFLITGRVTYSAAVHFTTVFRRYTNVTIIGEPASGRPNHYGAVRGFKLPNHPQIEISSSIDYYQDSEPFDFNVLIAPDIEIKMTSKDYQSNIDPAIEAVKNYDQIISFIKTTTTEFGNEYLAKGLPGVKKIYSAKKQVLLNSGYNQEKFMTEFYDQFLYKNKKSTTDLTDYLAFTVNECPESIRLCYSLAVQLESEGRSDEANTMYNRCIQLNPSHHYAQMKSGLLKLKDKYPLK